MSVVFVSVPSMSKIMYFNFFDLVADNGLAVSGVVTKERFPDHSMLQLVILLLTVHLSFLESLYLKLVFQPVFSSIP